MANVTFNIPNNFVPRILNAITKSGYERKDGETDLEYFKRYIKENIVALVFAVEKAEAGNSIQQDPTIIL